MVELHLGPMSLSSPAFASGAAIPARYAVSGDNVSPPLRWEDVPADAEELVLVMHDPDAPLVDGFTHWVLTGIDPTTDGLDEGTAGHLECGLNTADQAAYMGPAPPPGHGVHHYFFHLYALSERIDPGPAPTCTEVARLLEGRVLDQARLVGTFER